MVSIIIPSYNRIESLLKAIESISRQNNKGYEIIVVDDGSTDGTLEILKKEFHTMLVLSTKKRSGPAHARNIGISRSNGEYLWFLDSDVILPDENTVDKMLYTFNAVPGIGSLGGEIVIHEALMDRAYGRTITWNAHTNRVVVFKNNGLVECAYLATCNCFTKKEFADKIGGFDEQFIFGAEDMDFGLKLRKIGLKNYVAHEVAVHHFHKKVGRYENETRHYQKTRMQFAKKHYKMSCLFIMFLVDVFNAAKFYILLPFKLTLFVLMKRNITRQNIMGGWHLLQYYF